MTQDMAGPFCSSNVTVTPFQRGHAIAHIMDIARNCDRKIPKEISSTINYDLWKIPPIMRDKVKTLHVMALNLETSPACVQFLKIKLIRI